jgi:glycosyltransferase involved in cell wall biosynthesis
MNILISTQHFYPESFRINEIAISLIARSVNVDILTGKPNYPHGVIYEGYRAAGAQIEKWNQLNIFRIPIIARGKGGALKLFFNYLSFIFSGIFVAPFLLRGRKYDVVFCYATSPFLQVIPALFIAKLKKAKLVVNVQDLWPQSLVATGYVSNKFIISFVGQIVRFLYKNSDLLLLQSRAFELHVKDLAPFAKTVYWPNSVDSKFLNPNMHNLQAIQEFTSTDFKIVFAGNVGEAQSVNTIIELAYLLRELTTIKILILGKGSKWDWLDTEIKKRNLNNIVLLGHYPIQEMPHLMRMASVLLVTLLDKEIFAATIPNKIQAYMASGRPILAAINGEGAKIIEESEAGIVVGAEDVHQLANAAIKLFKMSDDDLNIMGCKGQAYFVSNFDHEHLISNLLLYFDQLIQPKE